MVTKAKVVKVDGKWMGEVIRSEACAKCGACQHGQQEKRYYPLPKGDWREGDIASITLPDDKAFAASLMGYGVPLAGLLLGLIAAFLLGAPDVWQLAGALIGLAAGYLALRLMEPFIRKSGKYTPHCKLYNEQEEE